MKTANKLMKVQEHLTAVVDLSESGKPPHHVDRVPKLELIKHSIKSIDNDLNENERDQLHKCEAVIRTHFSAIFEIGNALMTIRDRRLYRAKHETFDAYCRESLCISRSYAWRVLCATERLKLLPANLNPKPANESQIRPFLKLDAEQFPAAWQAAVKKAEDGRVTSSVAQKVIHEILGSSVARHKPRRGKQANKLPLGQILSLILEARRRMKQKEADQALAVLDQIEKLLFGGGSSQRPSDIQAP